MNTLILLVFAVMIAVEQATPISINNTTPTVSVQKTISVLKVEARNGVNSVYQDILTLESNNGEKYDSPYQGCYVQAEPTIDNVDINTLKDDVKSFNLLLPVIQDLADNETNEITADYYGKIISSMNESIVALNDLIAAVENTDVCEQLDKAAKLHALKDQAQLTDQHISQLSITIQTK